MKQTRQQRRTRRKYKAIVYLIGVGSIAFASKKGLQYAQHEIQVYQNHQEVQELFSEIEAYPEELIQLAIDNKEAVDFVLNYPEFKDKPVPQEINIPLKKGEIPLFIQWDEKWGYSQYGDTFMAINGCGPTALAMVAAGLSGDGSITPYEVAKISEANGYYVDKVGTSWSLMTEGAQKFGLIGKEIPLDQQIIINRLKEGKPIIASMGPGAFTTTGHFIVLTGITKDNKIKVNDPNSKLRSSKAWDIEVFMKQTKNLWVYEEI